MSSRWGARIVSLMLGLAGLWLAARPEPEAQGLALVRQAEAYFVEGAFTAAEVALQQAAAQLPTNDFPRRRLAALYAQWQRPTEGLQVLQTLPPETETPLRLQLLAASGDWVTLETVARDVAAHAPTHPEGHAALVQALLHQHRCAEAATAASRWERQAPDGEAAWLAGLLHWLTTPSSAASGCPPELCAALGLPPCEAQDACARRVGEALLHRRETALAACAFNRAIALSPDDASAHAWLGATLEQLGYPAAALPHLERATQLLPHAPLGWLLLGMARLRQQQLVAAREALLEAQRLDPQNPVPCLAIATLLAAEGRYSEVALWTAAALERAPDDAEIWKSVARFYLVRNLKLEDEPRHAAEGAVRLAPTDAEAWTLLGWVYFNTRAFEPALEALQTALMYDAKRPETYHFLGLTLRALGRENEAVVAFIRAADLGYR